MCVCKHRFGSHVDPGGCCIGDCPCLVFIEARTRVRTANFEHSHRVVEFQPPSASWFDQQGMEKVEPMKRRWFRG